MAKKHALMLICFLALGAALAFCAPCARAAEKVNLKNYAQALSYVKKNKPRTLDLGSVRFTPVQLLNLQKALPKNADFSFSTTWQGCAFTRKSKTVDLRKITARPARQDLEAIVKICPQCTKINLYGAPIPPYKTMVSLVKKYPKVDFLFAIRIHEYSLSSLDVAFSTLIKDQTCTRLTAAECEVLGACKYLKVLDLGHNNLYSLDFLANLKDLEVLIAACSHVSDLTPLSGMKHLKYLELFTTKVTDLSPLSHCRELLDLNISNTKITSLKGLDKVKSLERLWVLRCSGLRQTEINRFKKLHPSCKVQSMGEDITQEWRQHSRYNHFRWCLYHNRWIPFDQPLPTKTK